MRELGASAQVHTCTQKTQPRVGVDQGVGGWRTFLEEQAPRALCIAVSACPVHITPRSAPAERDRAGVAQEQATRHVAPSGVQPCSAAAAAARWSPARLRSQRDAGAGAGMLAWRPSGGGETGGGFSLLEPVRQRTPSSAAVGFCDQHISSSHALPACLQVFDPQPSSEPAPFSYVPPGRNHLFVPGKLCLPWTCTTACAAVVAAVCELGADADGMLVPT